MVTLAGCLGPPLALPDPNSAPVVVPTSAPGSQVQPARAFVVQQPSQLIDGPMADGQLGDYRLENERVAFIISAPERALGFAESGGNLIDAAPLGGKDVIKQLHGYLDDRSPRQPIYTEMQVAQRGDTAVVIARGHDSQDEALAITTEYALAPRSSALAITTVLEYGGEQAIKIFLVGDAVEWGRSEPFVPGHGFDWSGHAPAPAGWVSAQAGNTAYAYVTASGPLDGRHGWAWSNFNLQPVELVPHKSVTVTRWFAVAPSTDLQLARTIAELRHERWIRVSGHILEEGSGTPLADMRLVFDEHERGPLGVAQSTESGYEALLPPGEYRVSATAPGRRGPDRLDVSVSEASGPTTHDLFMSQRGTLAFSLRTDGAPSPGKLTFFGVGQTRDPRFGPRFAAPGANVALTVDGTGELPLPPGSYRVIASRGPEYTLGLQEIEVQPGATARAAFELKRALDGLGYVCIDLHQHTASSSDSGVTLADRAASNLAEGLETLLATDHNAIAAGWPQAIADLHAARPLAVLYGDEASAAHIGHFSVYPITPAPLAPRGGAPDVRKKSARELAEHLRGAHQVVQLNHPRAGGETGYFENLALEPRGKLPADFEAGFDALEIFSGKDTAKVEPALRDWLALLDRGMTYTAVGGSDSHLIVGQEVGYPRTCIPVDSVVPGKEGVLSGEALVAAIKQRREALVTNGPLVRISVAGKGMGQLVPAPRGRVKLDVVVQAAPWMDVRRLEVFVNGTRRGKPYDIPSSIRPVRFSGSIDVRIEHDAYVLVIVRGDAPLGPVVPGDEGTPAPTPLAITNPIYLDRDGDGRFTPPAAPQKPPPLLHPK
jgi:hypothetical protein